MDEFFIDITPEDLSQYITSNGARCRVNLNKLLSAKELLVPLFAEDKAILPVTLKLNLRLLLDLGKISEIEFNQLQDARGYDYEYELQYKVPDDEARTISVIKADHAASASIIGSPYRNHLGKFCLRVCFSLRQLANEPDQGTAEIVVETARYGDQSFTINYPPQGLGSALL
jgi:hypothetical protein